MEGSVKTKDVGKLDAKRLNVFQCEREDSGLKGPPKPLRTQNKALQVYGKLNIFREPMPLIAADATKRIHFNEDAISDLMKIKHPVNVVSVVGKYRTGKSLLLNRLARLNEGFKVGGSHNAMTKGIWIFCLPHPTQQPQVLVLLDTEGLDDAMKDNTNEERWYFILATLLSSTLVYNHQGTLDAGAIKKLEFLKNIKTSINVLDSEQGNDSNFDVFFPVLVIAVRDNYLETTDQNNDPISPDQFLENTLVLKRGTTDDIRQFNEPRILVRKYFKERRCFMFRAPRLPLCLSGGKMPQNKAFESDVESFLNYINECKPKRMTSGKVLSGRMFGSLVSSYTRYISEGIIPCLHEAGKEMIDFENQNILREAENVYKTEMQKLIGESMPSSEIMAKHHKQCLEKAIDYLRCNIIYDDIQLFLDTAKDSFIEILNRLEKSISRDSGIACWRRLDFLNNQRIGKKIKMQTYAHVTGYDEYRTDIEWIKKQYNTTTGLGPKKEIALQEYLDEKEKETEAIHQMVLKAQGEPMTQREEKSHKTINRSLPRQLPKEYESESNNGNGVSDDLLELVMEDQQQKKKDMTETFFTFMKLKIAEHERQLQEGAESLAAVTKKENDNFKETFLKPTTGEPTGLRPALFGEEKPYPPQKSKKCVIS